MCVWLCQTRLGDAHSVCVCVCVCVYVCVGHGRSASYNSELCCQCVCVCVTQVMPLRALLAPVRQYKDQITEAIESLTSETSQAANTATTASAGATPQAPQGAPQANGAPVAPAGGLQQPGMQRSASRIGRGLGPTLLAVIEYLQVCFCMCVSVWDTCGMHIVGDRHGILCHTCTE